MFYTLLLGHFIGDFPCQVQWFVDMKGKSYEVMFYHCAVYSAVVCALGKLGWLEFFILLGTHFVIDNLKARYKKIKEIWQDQLLHIGVLYLITVIA